VAVDNSNTGQIDDPQDTAQNERIKAILRRREEVLEARDRAKDQFYLGDIPRERAVMHYQSRLQTLLVDLRNKFSHELLKADKDYWESAEIATVEVPPPPALTDDDNLAPGEEPPAAKQVPIHGLSWFINHQPVIRREFTVSGWNPPRELSEPSEVVLGFEVIDEAVMTCFDFMNTLGIDADVTADTYTADGDPGI
jgi:hypothetical protein